MDREALCRRAEAGEPLDYVFFWGHRERASGAVGPSCMSQWYPAPFDVDGVRYATAEHFMMARKARLFDDRTALEAILVTDDPAQVKKLGRTIRNYDDARWASIRVAAVIDGNLAKFAQHPALAAYLRSTGERVLVEASPVDRIWGIGLAADDPAARDPRTWRGENLLGFALMRVRERLGA